MQEIEVDARDWRSNRSRHAIASFEQRPVERFPVERDEYRTLAQALGQRREQRMLFTVLTHEQLLDLQASAFPPCQADQKRIRSRPACESCRLRIKKKPLLGVRGVFRSIGSEQPQCRGIWSAWGMTTMPTVQ